jgi:hypothetical protein
MRLVSQFSRLAVVALVVVMLPAVPTSAVSQTVAESLLPPFMAGDARDGYWRALELAGVLPPSQWTIRPFGPREIAGFAVNDSMHPWSGRQAPPKRRYRGVSWTIEPGVATTIYNSAIPYGYNDGAVWAGKGLTQVLTGGVHAAYGALTMSIAPTFFAAQNLDFPLLETAYTDRRAFSTPLYGGGIDAPQRFGPEAYLRLDPGQSTIRVDAGPVTVGASSANEGWGPATESPLILGANAAGIPRVFLGTSKPINIGIGRAHSRVMYGRVSYSGYERGDLGDRYTGSLVGTFIPRGTTGFELGAARFFHIVAPDRKFPRRLIGKPFEGLLKNSLNGNAAAGNDDPYDNQLASIFLRWSAPGTGAEVYGEYGREDHNWNLRDLLGQPDHDAAYVVGLQRLWKSQARDRYDVLSFEILNTRISHLHQIVGQTYWYTHDITGHTQRGQSLGAAGGVGGGAASLAWTRYTTAGSTKIRLGRLMVAEVIDSTGLNAGRADVMQELTFERLRFGRGRQPDATVALTGVVEYNPRRTSGSSFNLNAIVRLSAPTSPRATTQPRP